MKPVIAITMGDPAGIGPEIIAKLFDSPAAFVSSAPVVIGSAKIMEKIVAELKLGISLRIIARPAEAEPTVGRMDIINLDNVDLRKHAWGRPTAASGRAVVEYITRAAEYALRDEASAVVTAPISKEMMNAAGFNFGGHTELLAHLTKAKEFGMLFVGGGLTLILVTIHHALQDVPRLITRAQVLKTIHLAHRAMQDLGIARPRIGVAALNPHASEGGLFGNEELAEILPAVLEARGEGIDASDPIPADTLFYKARNGFFDIVVAMYHDQGLAPLKMLAFGRAVNVTVGLPIVRTSVDHGTAYDIAGKGVADPASLAEAVTLAVRLAEARAVRRKERP
ncbi:MAG: 4-hydroxythreonine-4-phosphate dehydrogenase PdxA [Nitrospiraceae bacterium]|nr:4-hydroxythreonine-4-phosphate dehydrogenase PdxA [Nitrospiraceae bacterium]